MLAFRWLGGGRMYALSGLHIAPAGYSYYADHECAFRRCAAGDGYILPTFVIVIVSVLGWILLLTEEKTKKRSEACGLRLHGKLLTALVICVYFLAVKTAMVFLSMAAGR